MVSVESRALSQEIVRLAQENTRSGSSDIAGTLSMSIAIWCKRGYSILCSSRHHHPSGVFVVICLGGELTNFSNSSSSPGSSKTLIDCLIRSYGVTSRRSLLNRAAESDESGRSLYFAQCRRAPAMAVCRHSSAQWRSRYLRRFSGWSNNAVAYMGFLSLSS
jgi:hypothetical protein